MATKKNQTLYTIGLLFWRDVPKVDINAAIKKRLELVKKLRLGGGEMIWQGNGNAYKDKPSLGNLSFHLFFENKSDWKKALKKMDADKRFVCRPVKYPEIHKYHRGYRFIQPAKVRVGK